MTNPTTQSNTALHHTPASTTPTATTPSSNSSKTSGGSQADEDARRLPQGMQRVGYDASTQRYQFRDGDGTHWEGQEGEEFGEVRRVRTTLASEVQRPVAPPRTGTPPATDFGAILEGMEREGEEVEHSTGEGEASALGKPVGSKGRITTST